jgi:hypothetical protein
VAGLPERVSGLSPGGTADSKSLPVLWMSVDCECCVLPGNGICDSRSLVQRTHFDCSVLLHVIRKPKICGRLGTL